MQITVKTVCRVHFGFLDLCGDLGRLYGSIGIALDNPRTIVKATKANRLITENGSEKKIGGFLKRFSQHYRVQPAAKIQLMDSIPEHSGLGSGTQLALAVLTALAKICEIDVDVREMAGITGRGKRSGIGVACFETGGFIIDSGRKSASKDTVGTPPTVIFRHDFPADWCFVLVIPETAQGLSGREEDEAMKCLNSSGRISEEICRLTQVKLLPSLIEKDIEEFGKALTEIDLRTGRCFEKAQGGIHGGKIAEDLVEFMLQYGAYGAGQSSWGPTIYGLVDERKGQIIAAGVKDFLAKKNVSGRVFLSHCSNRGAEVTVSD
jgi:beta-ribofuranosylaminobenzene 5'-phosphate synthase